MSFWFGDGFDLYAAAADTLLGYWDSGTVAISLASGRFSGSRAIAASSASTSNAVLAKSSGSNDATHHLVLAIQQTIALTGTNNYWWFTFYDSATAQCSVVFRSDGAILLTSGGSTGTTLATYTGAIGAVSTWTAFEIEVVINNTTGSIAVRKNGNTSNDFSASSLNTRGGTANNYANRLGVGFSNAGGIAGSVIDDLLWRSDSTAPAWVGDIRCYTRRPALDAAVAWTPSGATVPSTPFTAGANATPSATVARYQAFTAPCNGTVGSLILSLAAANAGNVKCSIFSNSGSNTPAAVLGSATTLTGLALGSNTFTFGSPVAITQGTQYWVGFMTDTAASSSWSVTSTNLGLSQSGSTYAAFPTANPPSPAANSALIFTANITPTSAVNAPFVADIQQDAAAGYLYSSAPGAQDRYTLSDISSTPSTIVGVTTRGLLTKSDAGTRLAAVQLRSGATTVQSAGALSNSAWGWLWRSDATDPATGVPWTVSGVAAAQIGAQVTG